MSELGKKQLSSAIFMLIISLIVFYFGNRLTEQSMLSARLFVWSAMEEGIGNLIPAILANPFYICTDVEAVIGGGAFALVVIMVWLYRLSFVGNYRTGEEAGSARWATLKEVQRFKDEKNEDNNLIFTKNTGLALKKEKFDMEVDRNLNVIVIGGSGSGKTRNYVKPNLMQLNASYFVTDPKGTLIEETGHLFEQEGYKIRSFNTINFEQSMHYNPLKYVKTDADILSFINCLIANTKGEGTAGDPFWENAERLLYTALIALLRDWFPESDYSLSGLLTLLSLAEAREDDENFKSALDLIFLQIEEGRKYKKGESNNTVDYSEKEKERGVVSQAKMSNWVASTLRRKDGVCPGECGGLTAEDDFALDNYKAFKVAAGKTLKSIIISCNVRLKPLAIKEVRNLLKYDEMELDTLGDKDNKTIIYGILSDTDRTFSFLFAIMMWQTIDLLCRKAHNEYGGRLPLPVHLMFDEFANIGRIPDIETTIAVIRSRNIGMSIILQSGVQLETTYDKKAQTIIDCCDTTVFLGGKSPSTNKEIKETVGTATIHKVSFSSSQGQNASSSSNKDSLGRDLIDAAEVGKMSRKKAIVLIAGANPMKDDKFPVENHPRYKYIDPGHKGAAYDEPFNFVEYRKKQKM